MKSSQKKILIFLTVEKILNIKKIGKNFTIQNKYS